MSNICDNSFYFKCEKNGDDFLDKFKDIIPDKLYGHFDVYEYDEDGFLCIEGYFESKWSFPFQIFEELLVNYEDKTDPNDCYFRCLSTEYGAGYVAMNIYRDGHWLGEQTFDL